MLKRLALKNVGPASKMDFGPLGRRFNLVTGDNGLGKSFLLEAAWWALTRTWHESPAVPTTPNASIAFSFDSTSKTSSWTSKWDPEAQTWKRARGRPPNPGLVVYARVDGSFSTWDPARNYRLYQRGDGGQAESPPAYQFGPQAVFHGLTRDIEEAGTTRTQVLCAGLIDDWTRWQDASDPRFDLLRNILEHLGPDDQPLRPGKPIRPTLDDARRIPTIQMPYGQEVPLTYCPAGVRRMCNLAYLLAWTLSEHEAEAQRIGQPMSQQIIALIDEPETHLHPRWQRTVLPSLARALRHWRSEMMIDVQLLVATHSPLVLASMEPEFDESIDALWKLDLESSDVVLTRDAWHPRGDVNRWLMSDVFDLGAATSRDVERLLARAGDLLASTTPPADKVEQVDSELSRLLPQMDPFFIRWRHHMKAHLREGAE